MLDLIETHTIDFIKIVIAATVCIIHIYTTWKNAENSRLTLFQNLQNDFLECEEARKAYYSIEYGKYRYDANFHMSQKEHGIDKLLFKLNNISKLYQTKKISEVEFGYFEYYFATVCTNTEVKKYLSFVAEYADNKASKNPYSYLKEVGEAFESKKSAKNLKAA